VKEGRKKNEQADMIVCSLMTISPVVSALGLETLDEMATGSV
jgi:hypothetical protein